ncbi:hypothetical protein PanWU01x14_202320, partial [Parasponia andersonii]
VQNLPILESDYDPIVVDTEIENEKTTSPFRFLDAWSKDPSCRVMIAEAWKIRVSGFKSFQLLLKINNMGCALKK